MIEVDQCHLVSGPPLSISLLDFDLIISTTSTTHAQNGPCGTK